jgi:hypothetical protein
MDNGIVDEDGNEKCIHSFKHETAWDTGVDKRIIQNSYLTKRGVSAWIGFVWLRAGTSD